ncbi:MAG: homoserine dehydrogenase [Chloroflexi bacterium]|nr:homoserine dehydrogenase [Chloroflexota bacterium]
MSRAPLRVAVLGAGTVGREVVRALLDHPERLCASDGAPLVLAGVACRDLERARRAGIPAELLTDAPAHLVADPATDVVVELMGGDEPARTLVAAALSTGKPVVTANKHVVAHHGPALEAIARRADVALRFEAAVAGGIPVLGPLAADLAANEVRRVRGIVNGTTNYILSAMAGDGRTYGDVLADAQARGYAEADPAGDVEGDDAVNKLVILARLAFSTWIEPATVIRRPPTVLGTGRPGITGVTDGELAAAPSLGLAIKLLATTRPAGDGIVAGVLPTAVPSGSPFGLTGGVLNRVEIEAEPLGSVGLSGPGAGGAATSSAVLGDLVAVARGLSSTWAGRAPAIETAGPVLDPTAGPRDWFVFVPGNARDASAGASSWAGRQVVVAAGGLAVRVPSATLDEARAAVRPALTTGTDATLYPIDD